MSEVKKKSALILEYEEQFAAVLAHSVIDTPKLSMWMIMIPILFAYYFIQLNKYRDGLKMFAEHYNVSKKRALNEAVEAVSTGREPDIRTLLEKSDMPDTVREKQADLLAILVEHYTNLLKSSGNEYASLVRAAYGNLSNYLLVFNHLRQAEKEVNKALTPQMGETGKGISDIVSKMELHSERIWREMAESIFP